MDRRVVVVAPTPEGRRLTAERRVQFRGLWEEVLGDRSEAELATGVEVLERSHAFSRRWPSAARPRSLRRSEHAPTRS